MHLDLDLIDECWVAADALATVARSFRRIGRPVIANQCTDIATVLADLAHDLAQLLEDQP